MRINGCCLKTVRPRPWRSGLGASGALFLLALGILGLQVSAGAAEPAPKEIKPDAPCATPACHAAILQIKNLHGAAANNGCTACHTPEGNLHEFTFPAQGAELCATCHGPLEKKKVLHKPVGEGCTTCHNPHGGDTKALLVTLPPQLCTKCHAPIAAQFAKAASSHSAALQGKSCVTCHNPHTSDFDKLLAAKPMDVCLGCHSQEVKKDGQVLPSVKDQIAKAKVVHGPIQDGDCGACHDAHASGQAALLLAAYPAKFYAPFTPEAYALCFQCHDQALVQDAETQKSTNFRNGAHNLHTVHVKDEGKGRTCRACHAPHGANLPHLIRASVPFGPRGWPLPVGFKESKTGGSCAPGCHVQRAYDREKAVTE